MKKEELELVGLKNENPQGILDSEEKVRELREELERKIRDELKKWDTVKRDSQEKANRSFIS
jgi:hypothetical protein